MRKQRTILLDTVGRDDAPDVGDVLISDTRWYLVVDCDQKRKYLHCLCDVYHQPSPSQRKVDPLVGAPETDGRWWTMTYRGR